MNRNTLANALRVAADLYDDHRRMALAVRQDRLADQFGRQADEARAMADTIECSTTIHLED